MIEKGPKPSNPGEQQALTCGLVMPISALDGCTAEHWLEVRTILTEAVDAITEPQFVTKVVSDADDIGVIQKRIVQNLYSAEMVLCDVSGKNPNVMFELGMRLAFDKPVVIVKDDKTDYTFDTGIIEHVTYPRDLRFQRIIDFKKTVALKVRSTYLAGKSDVEHSPFLKNFGQFQVASLTETAVPADKLILSAIEDVANQLSHLRRRVDLMPRKLHGGRSPMSSLTRAIREFITENNISSPASLVDDPHFKQRILIACDAPALFDSGVEFEAALEIALRSVIGSQG